MEDLIISAKEHKLLKKFQKELEQSYKVEIRMPKTSSLASDVVFISVNGTKQNRDCVKNFLSSKMNSLHNIRYKENVMIVTLSDSEDDETSTIDDSICILEPSSCSESSPECRNKQTVCASSLDDSVCIIGTSTTTNDAPEVMENICNQYSQCKRKKSWKRLKKSRKRCKRYEKVRSNAVVSTLDADFSEMCEVSSTTDNPAKENHNNEPNCVEAVTSTKGPVKSIPFLEEVVDDADDDNDADVLILEPSNICSLRPIVIDGNNVAIEHGRVSHTFSSKGLLLAINYFLSRGHTQVTAFVPRFRRTSSPHRSYPTMEPAILDDLAEKQLVVFTPSRRLNGKNIVPYDDRFIVQLAATTGGVIVSNDNYRDLLNESDAFKEAIEKRLLMFCFVGDVFMVPEDPLGRDGPKLKDYLSFPPNPET